MAILDRRRIAAVACAALASACLGTTPQEREPAVQGDFDDGDPEHRPGQPCLLCHGPGHLREPPGQTRLAIAGTVFGLIDDDDDAGLENVLVTITDATGFEFAGRSNRTGNFMFEIDTGISDVQQDDRGQTSIPREPTYPLTVKISRGEDEQEMKTKIWRDGSCARCHGPRPGAASVGRVYLFDEDEQ